MPSHLTKLSPNQLADLIDKLQDWLESFKGLSEVPVAAVTLSAWTVEIAIGNVTLWYDQDDAWEDLSLDWLKNKWLDYCREVSKYLAPQSEDKLNA